MLAVRSLQHLSTVVLITAYGLVLVWYTVFGASPLHRCIYAVRPTGTNNDTALVWMKMNQTLLFLGAPTHPPTGAGATTPISATPILSRVGSCPSRSHLTP